MKDTSHSLGDNAFIHSGQTISDSSLIVGYSVCPRVELTQGSQTEWSDTAIEITSSIIDNLYRLIAINAAIEMLYIQPY